MLISLHHAQVFYPPGEEAQARDFYGKALGLEEIRRPDLGLHPLRHFALRVDDLAATRNRLQRCYCGVREAHTPSRRGRRRPPDYVFDPFGNKIELDEIAE